MVDGEFAGGFRVGCVKEDVESQEMVPACSRVADLSTVARAKRAFLHRQRGFLCQTVSGVSFVGSAEGFLCALRSGWVTLALAQMCCEFALLPANTSCGLDVHSTSNTGS